MTKFSSLFAPDVVKITTSSASSNESVVKMTFPLYCSSPSHYLNRWWRHQIETFSALLSLCEGNPPVTGAFPSQRPVTRSFDIFLRSAPEQTEHRAHYDVTVMRCWYGINRQVRSQIAFCQALKRKFRWFDEVFVNGCTGSCHFDNFRSSHSRKFIKLMMFSPFSEKNLW